MYQQVIECGIEYRPFVRCASFHFHRTESFLPTLDRAKTRACTIVLTTQCIYDGADITHYEVGVRAAELGALSGGLLPIEALYARLMILLAETPEGKMIKALTE